MSPLKSDLNDGILTLTIDRPKANAFDLVLVGELQSAFKQAGRDTSTRVIILTGAGRIFGAGQDIDEIEAHAGELSFREHLLKTYNPLVLQMRQIEKPVIAAVNGPCAGASLGIALACDLRLAVPEAWFKVGFSGIGLVPDSAVSLLLPALIGLGRATEFALTNDPISADQALAWGLVNHVVPAESLMAETTSLAARLASGPRTAFGLTKRAFNKAVLSNLESVLDYEAHLQEVAGHSADHKEGVAAFLGKRPPKFK
jgi:2-(1,2-epoxy-1,2-dihydrophenyl)acetyl-CoA isomerase